MQQPAASRSSKRYSYVGLHAVQELAAALLATYIGVCIAFYLVVFSCVGC